MPASTAFDIGDGIQRSEWEENGNYLVDSTATVFIPDGRDPDLSQPIGPNVHKFSGQLSNYLQQIAVQIENPFSGLNFRRINADRDVTAEQDDSLQRKIFSEYTWEQTALKTAEAYRKLPPFTFTEK